MKMKEKHNALALFLEKIKYDEHQQETLFLDNKVFNPNILDSCARGIAKSKHTTGLKKKTEIKYVVNGPFLNKRKWSLIHCIYIWAL